MTESNGLDAEQELTFLSRATANEPLVAAAPVQMSADEVFARPNLLPSAQPVSNMESLLGSVVANQELMLAELKKKNKYEAWKTFFAGVKLFVYVAIIYVSYVGMMQLVAKLESGDLQKSLMSGMNIESMISNSENGGVNVNGVQELLSNFGGLEALIPSLSSGQKLIDENLPKDDFRPSAPKPAMNHKKNDSDFKKMESKKSAESFDEIDISTINVRKMVESFKNK